MYSKIEASYKVDSAHFVPDCASKCENLHGHTWNIKVELSGILGDDGMLVDFGIIKMIVDELDHGCGGKVFQPVKIIHPKHGKGWFVKNIMNDLMEQPTAEVIAEWLYKRIISIEEDRVDWCRITVEESPGKNASYETKYE